MTDEKKLETETPKIEPLDGFIETRYVKCGRSNCHCAASKGHGPYHYWMRKSGGRKFKRYIKRVELPIIVARIEERRRLTREKVEFDRKAKQCLKTCDAQLRELRKLLGV